jgi:predicted nuclease of restriction endonuclease-like (RecB) superfamily
LIAGARATVARGVDLVQVHTTEAQFSRQRLEDLRRLKLVSQLTDRLAIGQSLSGQLAPPPRPFALSWSHYVFLLGVKNADERSFYEIEATNQNWTVRELKRQFNSGLYERLALSRDKEGIRRLAQEGQIVAKASDLFKEPLVLEFLGLDERSRYSESDLESAIISQIERFLLEMGRGFLFESRQKRFTFDEDRGGEWVLRHASDRFVGMQANRGNLGIVVGPTEPRPQGSGL